MMQRLLRVVLMFGVLVLAGTLVNSGSFLAGADDRDNGDRNRVDRDNGDRNSVDRDNGGQDPPPQTLPQGFESTRDLLMDAHQAERAPKYSAWIVESSRFLRVPFRAFMPDRGDKPTVDLPVNVGIIKAPNGDI